MKPLNPRSLDRLAGGGLRNSPASRTRAIIPMRRGPASGLGVGPGLHGPAEPRSASWEERAILEALTGRPGFTPHGQGRPHRPAGLGRPGPRPRRWESTNRPNGAAASRRRCRAQDREPWNTHPFGPGAPLPLGTPGAPLSSSILVSVVATSAAASTPAAIFSASGLCVRELDASRCACALT